MYILIQDEIKLKYFKKMIKILELKYKDMYVEAKHELLRSYKYTDSSELYEKYN